MTRLSLFALALTLSLTACAQREADVVAPRPAPGTTTGAMPADGAMDDPIMSDGMASSVTVEGTLDAAQSAGGLTAIAPSAAVSNIDGWIARLEGTPANAPIVANLRTLRSQLQAPTLDGMAIGRTLAELGEQTTAAAAGDASVRQLGQALSQAGQTLTGM